MNTIFHQEATEAKALINVKALYEFFSKEAYTVIGTKRTQNGDVPTTLEEQALDVIRMAHTAYIADGVNYYNRRDVMRHLLLGEEELQRRSANAYRKAAAKLIWLSSKSRELGYGHILVRFVDKEDLEACQGVVDAFEFLIRNYEELVKREA